MSKSGLWLPFVFISSYFKRIIRVVTDATMFMSWELLYLHFSTWFVFCMKGELWPLINCCSLVTRHLLCNNRSLSALVFKQYLPHHRSAIWLPILSPHLLMITQMVLYIMYWGHWNLIFLWYQMTCIPPRVWFFRLVKTSWEPFSLMGYEKIHEDSSWSCVNLVKKWNKKSWGWFVVLWQPR